MIGSWMTLVPEIGSRTESPSHAIASRHSYRSRRERNDTVPRRSAESFSGRARQLKVRESEIRRDRADHISVGGIDSQANVSLAVQ